MLYKYIVLQSEMSNAKICWGYFYEEGPLVFFYNRWYFRHTHFKTIEEAEAFKEFVLRQMTSSHDKWDSKDFCKSIVVEYNKQCRIEEEERRKFTDEIRSILGLGIQYAFHRKHFIFEYFKTNGEAEAFREFVLSQQASPLEWESNEFCTSIIEKYRNQYCEQYGRMY